MYRLSGSNYQCIFFFRYLSWYLCQYQVGVLEQWYLHFHYLHLHYLVTVTTPLCVYYFSVDVCYLRIIFLSRVTMHASDWPVTMRSSALTCFTSLRLRFLFSEVSIYFSAIFVRLWDPETLMVAEVKDIDIKKIDRYW